MVRTFGFIYYKYYTKEQEREFKILAIYIKII